jgi:hypothetical protein
MKQNHRTVNAILAAIITSVMIVSAVNPGRAEGTVKQSTDPQTQSGVRVGYNSATGKLSFVGAEIGRASCRERVFVHV